MKQLTLKARYTFEFCTIKLTSKQFLFLDFPKNLERICPYMGIHVLSLKNVNAVTVLRFKFLDIQTDILFIYNIISK